MTTNHTPTYAVAAVMTARGLTLHADGAPIATFDNGHECATTAAALNANRALTARVAEGIARVAELSDTLAAIGAADEQPGHPHYLSKARMAALAREALRGAA